MIFIWIAVFERDWDCLSTYCCSVLMMFCVLVRDTGDMEKGRELYDICNEMSTCIDVAE